jgi:hypothetical protein
MFFIVAVRDMRRRGYILDQLGQYLSPKKLVSSSKEKLLPTINILDQVTMHTWMNVRKLSIDYGKKYFYRHEIFLPVMFSMGIISITFTFLLLSGIVTTGSGKMGQEEFMKLIYAFSSNSIFYMTQFFWLLYSASSVNEEFKNHIEIMEGNKTLLNDMLYFKEFYFADHIKKHSKNIAKEEKT